ncbi:MAG: hypothetical protein KGL44_05555 [Sphingomonadales bacterium]|nr:hypothetical protein [Sphingomonadales bacterium]
MKRLVLPALAVLLAPLLLSGCIAYHIKDDGTDRAEIGETVIVGGPKVTPLKLLEDSRCPQGVQCVWAGQVRIEVRVDLGSRSETRELTLGKGEQVADGTLTLVEVMPEKRKDTTFYPEDYRFGFRFAGGL